MLSMQVTIFTGHEAIMNMVTVIAYAKAIT